MNATKKRTFLSVREYRHFFFQRHEKLKKNGRLLNIFLLTFTFSLLPTQFSLKEMNEKEFFFPLHGDGLVKANLRLLSQECVKERQQIN